MDEEFFIDKGFLYPHFSTELKNLFIKVLQSNLQQIRLN